MSDRSLIMQTLTMKMREAFLKGDLNDAQNIAAYLDSLENMTDAEYTRYADDAAFR